LNEPMRYVVLDTDVASRAIKGTLGHPLAARLTGKASRLSAERTPPGLVCVCFTSCHQSQGVAWEWS
jgi:hypothetical protein